MVSPSGLLQKVAVAGNMALDGGGALINQAVHTVDLMLWLFGEVVSVQATSKASLHAIEAEDTLVALLEFANGALGVLQAATSAYPGYPRQLELTGSEGTLIIAQDRLLAADLRNPPADLQCGGKADPKPQRVLAHCRRCAGTSIRLEDFLRSIQTNTNPRCDGREGRRSLALVEAIYAACRTGELVRSTGRANLI